MIGRDKRFSPRGSSTPCIIDYKLYIFKYIVTSIHISTHIVCDPCKSVENFTLTTILDNLTTTLGNLIIILENLTTVLENLTTRL